MSTTPPYVHVPYIYPPYGIPAMPPAPTDTTSQLCLRIGALESELAHVRSELHTARKANHFLVETYSHVGQAATYSPPETKDHAALTKESKVLDMVSRKLRDTERDRSLLQADFDELNKAYDRLETLSKLQAGTRTKRGGHVSNCSELNRRRSFEFPAKDSMELSENCRGSPPSSQSPPDGAEKAKEDEEIDLLGGDTYTAPTVPKEAAAAGVHVNDEEEDEKIRPALKRWPSMYDKAIPRAPTPVFEELFINMERKDSTSLHDNSAERSHLPPARSAAMPEGDLSIQRIDLPHRPVLQHQSAPGIFPRHAQALYRPSPVPAWQDYAHQAAIRHGFAYNDAPPARARPPPYTDLDAVGMLNHKYRHHELDYGESFVDNTAAASSNDMQSGKIQAYASGMIEELETRIGGADRAHDLGHNTANAITSATHPSMINPLNTQQTKVSLGFVQSEVVTNSKHAPRSTEAVDIKYPSVPSFGSLNLVNIKATNPRQFTVPHHHIPSKPKALRHLDRRIVSYAESDVDTCVAESRASTPTPATSVPGREIENDIDTSDGNDGEIGEGEKSKVDRDDPALPTSASGTTHAGGHAGIRSSPLDYHDAPPSVQIEPVKYHSQSPSSISSGLPTKVFVTCTTHNPIRYISTRSAVTPGKPMSPISGVAIAFTSAKRQHISESESESSIKDGEIRERRSASPSPTSSGGEGESNYSKYSNKGDDSGDGTDQQSNDNEQGGGGAAKRRTPNPSLSTSTSTSPGVQGKRAAFRRTHQSDTNGAEQRQQYMDKRMLMRIYESADKRRWRDREEEDAARKWNFWQDLRAGGEGRRGVRVGRKAERGLVRMRVGMGVDESEGTSGWGGGEERGLDY